jgi:uncharacterized membrane protein
VTSHHHLKWWQFLLLLLWFLIGHAITLVVAHFAPSFPSIDVLFAWLALATVYQIGAKHEREYVLRVIMEQRRIDASNPDFMNEDEDDDLPF